MWRMGQGSSLGGIPRVSWQEWVIRNETGESDEKKFKEDGVEVFQKWIINFIIYINVFVL